MVLVTVTDVGISRPSFPSSTVNIIVSEGALSGASVYQGNAVDPDGDTLTYSMSQVNNNQITPDFVISTRYIDMFVVYTGLRDYCLNMVVTGLAV